MRSSLPTLKLWRHDKMTSNFESYTIALSPGGQLVQSRTTPRAVPKEHDVIYSLVRWKNRWHVEYATASRTVYIGKDGEEVDHGVGSDHSFPSVARARAAANRHWQKGSRK